jgi:hypothetical protein
MKSTKRKSRIWCEDASPLYRSIKQSKNNGKVTIVNGIEYHIIGDDMMLNTKTNLIEVR